MAGEARTSDFLLSTATLMIGPQAQVMELSPALHSIGLVKNVQLVTEPTFVSLTQGVTAVEVASVQTATPARVSSEVYEYTARNLAYGANIDATGTGFAPNVTSFSLATAITTGGTSVVLGTGQGATFNVGDFFVIQDLSTGDLVHVGKVASKVTDTLTLATGYSMPTTMQFAIATTVVYKVQNIKVGSNLTRPVLGAKLVGTLPGSGEPITIVFPKVRISKGLSLAFNNENFSNMPFEFMPQALLPTDTYYGDFGGSKTFSILKR